MRWHRLDRREPTEQEVISGGGVVIVCSSVGDVVVMAPSFTPFRREDGSLVSLVHFNVPWGVRWSGDVIWWRPMPAAPGVWRRRVKKWLDLKWWQHQLIKLRSHL